jgi:hypothetical protein
VANEVARHEVDASHPIVRIKLERLVGTYEVRTAISGYLENVGIVLDRDDPRSWFYWLDDEHTVCAARCAEPPPPDAEPDDGWQAWNFFALCRVERSDVRVVQRISAFDIVHDADPEVGRQINSRR